MGYRLHGPQHFSAHFCEALFLNVNAHSELHNLYYKMR